jgi:hypothetical protein
MPMQRTLKEIIGEGRRCQYCDRPLRPNVEYVRVIGHAPRIEQALTSQGYDAAAPARL